MFELMPFVRRNNDMMRYFDRMEREMMKDFAGISASGMDTDIVDQGDHYLLQAELPGFSKEEVKVQLDGDTLTISAEHNEESGADKDDKQYLRRERRYGYCSRSFQMDGVDTSKISAQYKDGVLELTLPKKNQPELPETKQIAIE